MPFYAWVLIFFGALALVLAGSVIIAGALSNLGRALEWPEQFLGLVIALGSDSPEIASAIVAIISGHQDVGAGVVFGSNLFNLASLHGLSAIIAGGIRIERGTVLLNGLVTIAITALAILLAIGVAPPLAPAALIVAITLPYAASLWMRRAQIENLPLPGRWKEFLAAATSESQEHGREIEKNEDERQNGSADPKPRQGAEGVPTALTKVGIALLLIVGGSIGLVRGATHLSAGWLPHALLGPLVLAALTGIPNVYTATLLALHHRGAAVLTETMNSNILNVAAGLAVPSLVFGGVTLAGVGALSAFWLLGLSAAAVVMCARRGGLSRVEGTILVAAYLVYVGLSVHVAL